MKDRRLIKYLSNYKKECVLAPLFKMLEAVFELTVPLVVARMIDSGIASGSFEKIVRSFGVLILLGFVGLIVSCTAQFFAAKAATGFSKELRHDLFGHILSLGFSEIDGVGTSTLITRMTSDVNILQNGVNMFLRLFLRSPFIVLGAMIMAFAIDAKAALIFVLVIAVLSVVVFLVMKTNIPILKKVQNKLDEVLMLVRENLSGARVIRAFTLEEDQVKEFSNANSDLTGLSLKAGRISGLLNPLTYVIVNVGIAALVIVGGIRIDAGALTVGEVVALYNYMSQILLELIKFANLIVTLNRSFASSIRVNEVFDIHKNCKGHSEDALIGSDAPAVRFDHVSMRYHPDADEAISDISFEIGRGTTFGIVGGTGAGKSTVANLIPGFYDATSGSVYVGGQDVKSIADDMLRKHVGIVMQKAVLFKGTIRDNLKWGNENASDEELMEAARLAVCSEVIKEKGGLDAVVEAGGKNFSGGQKQRLSIARVLAAKPEILILDDSSSALDYMTDQKLRQNITSLSYKPTVIIIAQRTISVQGCDSILVLDDGDQIGLGTHEQLLDSCPVYREINSSRYQKEGA